MSPPGPASGARDTPDTPDGVARPTPADGAPDAPRAPVVDLAATARRLRWMLLVIGVVVLAVWLAGALTDTGLALARLGELVGYGLLAAFLVELVVVGGAALAGMLRAGARGDRLASDDVGLVPPQLRRRRRR